MQAKTIRMIHMDKNLDFSEFVVGKVSFCYASGEYEDLRWEATCSCYVYTCLQHMQPALL